MGTFRGVFWFLFGVLWGWAPNAEAQVRITLLPATDEPMFQVTDELIHEFFSPDATPSDKERNQAAIALALTRLLDGEARRRNFYPDVPTYRVVYALERIFEENLDSRTGNWVKDYALLRARLSAPARIQDSETPGDVELRPPVLFAVDWNLEPKSSAGQTAFKKIRESGSEWIPLMVSFPSILPETFQEFQDRVRQRAEQVYRSRTRKKVFDELLAEAFPEALKAIRQVSPREMREVFRKNTDDFRIQDTEMELLEVRFKDGTPEELEALRSDFLSFAAIRMEGVFQRWQERSGKLDDLMTTRRDYASRLVDDYLKERPTFAPGRVAKVDHRFLWPIRPGTDVPPSEVVEFALKAPLGQQFLPNVNYETEGRSEFRVLFMVAERLGEVRTLPFENLEVQRALTARIQSTQYFRLMPRLVEKLIQERMILGPSTSLPELMSLVFQKMEESFYSVLMTDWEGRRLHLAQSKSVPQPTPDPLPTPSPIPHPSPLPAPEDDVFYRFPDLYNPNPIGGRLYLQPIGPHEDRVVEGLVISVSYLTSSEFNRKFHDSAKFRGKWPHDEAINDSLLYMNSRMLQIRVSHGFKIRGFKFEAGAIVRTFQDTSESEMKVFLAEFHDVIGSPNPSPDQPYNGTVGKGRTVVIGPDGQIYMTTAELYAKVQLLDNSEKEYIPNLSLKFSVKVPISGLAYDTWGVGISAGVSQKITDWLTFIAAGSVSYQDLSSDVFGGDNNLLVRRWVYDLFGGVVIDPFAKGGFYMTLGLRYSSVRMTYGSNPDSSHETYVAVVSLNYLSPHRDWEVRVFFSEEIPGLEGGLEPDFSFGVNFTYYLDTHSRRPVLPGPVLRE